MKEKIKCYCGHTITCDCGEEPKQHIIDIMKSDEELGLYEEPKQETLEEVAEIYAEPYRCPSTNDNEYCRHDIISAINFGAKWQQERSYSEEDMEIAFGTISTNWISFEQFIKQFKNK